MLEVTDPCGRDKVARGQPWGLCPVNPSVTRLPMAHCNTEWAACPGQPPRGLTLTPLKSLSALSLAMWVQLRNRPGGLSSLCCWPV